MEHSLHSCRVSWCIFYCRCRLKAFLSYLHIVGEVGCYLQDMNASHTSDDASVCEHMNVVPVKDSHEGGLSVCCGAP